MKRWIVCLMLIAAIFTVCETQASELQRQILRRAPDILAKLREKGYRNVGVLKFRVKKGADPVSDNVGSLNMLLANQLETALTLYNANDPAKQVGITRRASVVAAQFRGVNYATAESRAPLFTADYPLAWGTGKVRPDAFLTGVVLVSADLREMMFTIVCFDKKTAALERLIPTFVARTDAATLSEMGESFVLRGAFDQSRPQPAPANATLKVAEKANENAVAKATEVRTKSDAFPLLDKAAPVTMEVLYDGAPAPVDTSSGKATIPEPNEGQKVSIVVRRVGAGNEPLAVVLKVNGENTLDREKLRDIDCRKWVMQPGVTTLRIGGYQTSASEREDFRVASKAESKTREVDFGEDLGTITMTVFAEQKTRTLPADLPGTSGAQPPDDLKRAERENEDLAALSRGLTFQGAVKNLAALKSELRKNGDSLSRSRGAVVGGEKSKFDVKSVEFKPDPTPVMSVVVTYYKPS